MAPNDAFIVIAAPFPWGTIRKPVVADLIERSPLLDTHPKTTPNLLGLVLMLSQGKLRLLVLLEDFAVTLSVRVLPSDSPLTVVLNWLGHFLRSLSF
jgi:hypothetical protein